MHLYSAGAHICVFLVFCLAARSPVAIAAHAVEKKKALELCIKQLKEDVAAQAEEAKQKGEAVPADPTQAEYEEAAEKDLPIMYTLSLEEGLRWKWLSKAQVQILLSLLG
jgi:hypothetical protein